MYEKWNLNDKNCGLTPLTTVLSVLNQISDNYKTNFGAVCPNNTTDISPLLTTSCEPVLYVLWGICFFGIKRGGTQVCSVGDNTLNEQLSQ